MKTQTTHHTLIVQALSAMTAFVYHLHIEQVLTNLVDNADKYSPAGGEVTLNITQPVADLVQIEVRNHGLGIPPEHRPKIFDRFYQAHTEHHLAGLGMGLYISRHIVELHGGSIEAEFPSDGGTRVVVTLPVSGFG